MAAPSYKRRYQRYERVDLAILNSFSIEKRLAGFAPEHVLMALPKVLLQSLDRRYVASLPLDLKEKIQQKLQDS